MAYMHVLYNVAQHETGYPANTLAQEYGQHLLNVKLSADHDNGDLIAVDVSNAWDSFDVFNEAAVSGFSGIVEQRNSNGNWIICVLDPSNALFLYQKPLTPYESPRELKEEKAFFMKAGDIGRAYCLAKFDRIEVSEGHFSTVPVKGAIVSGYTNGKYTVTTGYTAVSTPTANGLSNYYEIVNDEFVKTTDTTVVTGKTYYTKN